MAKFTFKTEKSKGPYSSFFPCQHYIKLNKKIVGTITDDEWKIRLKIYKDENNTDDNPNCKWKWITLVRVSSSLQEAKQFLNDNFEAITEKYKLYSTE